MQTIDIIKAFVEIVQGCITTIGLIIAGLWSYYVFIRGRTFEPNIQIAISLKQSISYGDKKAAIVSLKMKNIGKARIDKDTSFIEITPISIGEDGLLGFNKPDSDIQKKYTVLKHHSFFEPNEETIDDILVNLGTATIFKVIASFTSQDSNNFPYGLFFYSGSISSSTSAILDLRTAPQIEDKQPQNIS